MPNKQNAQYDEWKMLFEKIIALMDEDIILVGYSLGGTFLAKYLSENTIGKRVKKVLLLGTPFDNEDMDQEPLCSFYRNGDLQNLQRQAGELFFYHSDDDFAVPFSHLLKYKEALPQARYREMKGHNHFIQESVPELVEGIRG